MPQRVWDVVDQRLKAVQAVLSKEMTARQAAAHYEVSKTQVYEWVRRFNDHGVEGLFPRSRRPHTSPNQTPADVEDAVVRLRKDRHNRWGSKKIRPVLLREGVAAPATSTIDEILLRRGARPPRNGKPVRREAGQRFERPFCNDLWQIDGTQHRLRNGTAFWVVDLVDDHSRFLLATVVGSSLTGALAWSALRTAVAAYGQPAQLLSDNGTTFTGRLHATEVRFEIACGRAGITLIHARIYHPQTLGKDERQHGTQNAWVADHRPRSLSAAQRVLDAYRQDYNTYRPHESLGQVTPAERYTPSEGVLLPGLDDLSPADDYPAGSLLRKVDSTGRFRYANTVFTVPLRYADVPVGLIRDGARLHVYYGSARIKTIAVGDLPHPARYRGNH